MTGRRYRSSTAAPEWRGSSRCSRTRSWAPTSHKRIGNDASKRLARATPGRPRRQVAKTVGVPAVSDNPLDQFQKRHEFLVAIDSDGCAFDTMEVKHKECFIPNTIKYFHLQAVSKFAREAAEFVNLYSKWRGINR